MAPRERDRMRDQSQPDERSAAMWAQLITATLKPGKEGELRQLVEQLRASEQPGSGLVRPVPSKGQNAPSRTYMLVVFESEDQARARENDPRRDEALSEAR